MKNILLIGASLLLLSGCGEKPNQEASTLTPVNDIVSIEVATDGDFAFNLQSALIAAKPNSTVTMPAGTFKLVDGVSLDVTGVTLRGAGQGKTILDFSGQTGSGEGLLVTSSGVTLSDFTIRDTAGDGIKSKGADNIIYQDLTVEWSGEPDQNNGAYGVYPVSSKNILIQRVTVRGASDAGIYVGQSENIIVRNSLAEYNVAGIEIENSYYADVYKNTAQHNSGGILIFDLPNLPVMGGHSTRVFDNDLLENNTPNFAPAGNIVATVPAGTGIIIMANDNIHIFGNRFKDNQTVGIIVGAYPEPFEDETYNPLPRNIVVRDNHYEGGGNNPQGMLGEFAAMIGGRLPPVMWDGVDAWHGGDPVDVNLSILEDESTAFLNMGLGSYPVDESKVKPKPFRPKAKRGPEPSPVTLPRGD